MIFRLRRDVGVLLLLPFVVASGPVMAEIRWDPAWNVSSNGMSYSVETFAGRLAVKETVQRIIAGKGHYDHYLVADGRMLLSGVREGTHWVAEIRGSADGATGYVSALYFDPAAASSAMAFSSKVRHFQFDESAASVSIDWSGGEYSEATRRGPSLDKSAHQQGGPVRFTVADTAPSPVMVSIMEH